MLACKDAGTCASAYSCRDQRGYWVFSFISVNLNALRQGLSASQKLAIVAMLLGQWALGICLSLSHNAGVIGMSIHAQLFTWVVEIQT